MIKNLAEEFSGISSVIAIALSGSKTSAINDSHSDWDIYIYSDERVPLEDRERILSQITAEYRIDCSPFEEGDEAKTADGMELDIMYRSKEWTEWQVEDVWIKHNARVGYTTCFLYNIATSEILYDKNGWLSDLKETLKAPYPENLRRNIIEKNLAVIDGDGFSTFLIQAGLAWERHDIVSQNHRLSAIIASCFDILFAYNRALHPGEKKLVKYAYLLCHLLPDSFEEKINTAIASAGKDTFIPALKDMIDNMKDFLSDNFL